MKVSVSLSVALPPTVVVENAVSVPVVLVEETVPSVVTPVSVVVRPTMEVVRLVVVLVDRMDVKVVVAVPTVGPATVRAADVVPVTHGAFVTADKVAEPVTVENVEVVLVELVEEVELVDETTNVVVDVGAWLKYTAPVKPVPQLVLPPTQYTKPPLATQLCAKIVVG